MGGGYTVVKDHVRIARASGRETFVPLAHPPGHAQVDFGEAVATIGGVRRKIHFFCMDLPQSDACFVKACIRARPPRPSWTGMSPPSASSTACAGWARALVARSAATQGPKRLAYARQAYDRYKPQVADMPAQNASPALST
jgi:hypothetical protein